MALAHRFIVSQKKDTKNVEFLTSQDIYKSKNIIIDLAKGLISFDGCDTWNDILVIETNDINTELKKTERVINLMTE